MEDRKHMQDGALSLLLPQDSQMRRRRDINSMCDEEQNFTNQAEPEATIQTVQKGYYKPIKNMQLRFQAPSGQLTKEAISTWLEKKEFGTTVGNLSGLSISVECRPISSTCPLKSPACGSYHKNIRSYSDLQQLDIQNRWPCRKFTQTWKTYSDVITHGERPWKLYGYATEHIA